MNNGVKVSELIDKTQERWQATWLKNAFENGRRSPSIRPLREIVGDDREAIIICGSGPSLMNDIEKLKSDPSIIIANHSNLGTLLYYNIIPDFVIVADANEIITERLKPLFNNGELKMARIPTYILPTHASPKLVDLLQDHGCDMYFYPNIARKLTNDASCDFYNTVLQFLTPSLDYEKDGQTVTDCIVQAGCVVNAALLFSMYLLINKTKDVKEIYFSGADFSYPMHTARCPTVVFLPDGSAKLDLAPDFDPEPPRFCLNGLLTDENQLAYYRDFRFIVSVFREEFPNIRLYTTTKNFISDFLDVKAF
jgi:hypothetical protein